MDKRSDILEAAAALFAQFSLKRVTVDEIAEKASVSKATIYKYFDSKEEVFIQVVKAESQQLWDQNHQDSRIGQFLSGDSGDVE